MHKLLHRSRLSFLTCSWCSPTLVNHFVTNTWQSFHLPLQKASLNSDANSPLFIASSMDKTHRIAMITVPHENQVL
jgi:hypothetical protein